MNRKNTKTVYVANVPIGGKSPVSVQSMLNVHASDIENSVRQSIELEKAGCEILRLAVPNLESVNLIEAIKKQVKIPLVADIHFDYKIAIECANAGIDKIRINPGNIGSDDRVKQVADICKLKKIPIRIGVNSGSVEKDILKKYGKVCPEALCESAIYHTKLLEKFDFDDIVISIKSSDVITMVKSYELMSEMTNYPLHLGVTEAGTKTVGLIKSSVGIGSLLLKGIGDTIRISLTDEPVEEIKAAKELLKCLGLRNGIKLISCPTCGRTGINLIELANKVEKAIENIDKDISVAVMGCEVNGPGEAKEADIGVAGGKGVGILFKKGKIIKKLKEEELLSALLHEIEKM